MTLVKSCCRGRWFPLTLGSVLLLIEAAEVSTAEERSTQKSIQPLVDQAYSAELEGRQDLRASLLQRALEIDPVSERPNWLLGRVQVDGKWLAFESAVDYWSGNPILRSYTEFRDSVGSALQGRLDLANWCRDKGLIDRERVHLIEASRLRPGDPVLMRRLGLRKFHDLWLPEEEIERIRQTDDVRRRAETKWKPIFTAWRADFVADDPGSRDQLAARLGQVTEETAFPILEEVLSLHSEATAQRVVAHLDTQSSQGATESLLRHAVFSEYESVRGAAAESLKRRSRYNYLPWLIASLEAPTEVTVDFPHGGTNYVRRTIVQRGPEYDLVDVHHRSHYEIRFFSGSRPGAAAMPGPVPRGLKPGKYIVDAPEKTRWNARIREVLYLLTGEAHEDPERWWNWWDEYTEFERPESKPVYERHTAASSWRSSYHFLPSRPRGSCCVAPGTTVATETGPRPVEQIVPGDKVLAQDSDTGRLELKVVLERTVRTLGEMREVSLGDDSLTITLGHPAWVVGKGWRMAKELEVGHRLVCLGGSRQISAIEELPADLAYNIVVDGSGTYFAGDSLVLLHDNSLPGPTDAILPGFVPNRQP